SPPTPREGPPGTVHAPPARRPRNRRRRRAPSPGAMAASVTGSPPTAGVSDPAPVLGGGGVRRRSEVGRGGQQGDVAEGLREVAPQPARPDVVLLAQQTDVVPHGEQSLEDAEGLLAPPDEGEGVGEPEGAGEECALSRRQAIHPQLGGVPEDEAVTQ